MTHTDHEFRLRFRANEHEDEGKGSLRVDCMLADRLVRDQIRQIVQQVSQEHPHAKFDGMTYHAPRERA